MCSCLFVCCVLVVPVFSHVGKFPGLNQYRAEVKCLAHSHSAVPPMRRNPITLRSQARRSTTEPFCFYAWLGPKSKVSVLTANFLWRRNRIIAVRLICTNFIFLPNHWIQIRGYEQHHLKSRTSRNTYRVIDSNSCPFSIYSHVYKGPTFEYLHQANIFVDILLGKWRGCLGRIVIITNTVVITKSHSNSHCHQRNYQRYRESYDECSCFIDFIKRVGKKR